MALSEIYINFERHYSFIQLVKTLNFMGLSYSDLYSDKTHSVILRNNLYKENKMMTYLGRGEHYSECGFLIFNLKKKSKF